MKVLILADPASPHTMRWGNSLNAKGIEVVIFGFSKEKVIGYSDGVKLIINSYPLRINISTEASISKISYIFVLKKIKKVIRDYQPDVLHAHYATSYGMLASLTGFQNIIISPWGSDLLSFPTKSFLHRLYIRFILKKARLLLPSSSLLKQKIIEICECNNVEVLPFGINIEPFQPAKSNYKINIEKVVIGTVKALEHNYGIDLLIQSLALLKVKCPDLKFKLKIVGRGSAETELKNLVSTLNLSDSVEFLGYIDNTRIPELYRSFDIVVVPSRRESFGVSILEAYAAGVPVVASDILGFNDVCKNDETVVRFKNDDVNDLTEKMIYLLRNESMRKELARNAQQFVAEQFSLDKVTDRLINYYHHCIK